MEIKNTGKAGQIDKSKKKSKNQATSGAFGNMLSTGESQNSSATASMTPISGIDVLLAAQSVEDPMQKGARSRMRNRANLILDQLEKIKISILSGQLTMNQMVNLAQMIASQKEKITDPAMNDIFDEIDMRAQIEIAKMKKSIKIKS